MFDDSIKKPLTKMLLVLGVTIALALWQIEFVIESIKASIYLNVTIVTVFVFGAVVVFRNTISLSREMIAMSALRHELELHRRPEAEDAYETPAVVFKAPPLMGPTFDLLSSQIIRSHRTKISAATMATVLDGVAGRVFDRESIAQYIIGILVLFGLIGTFVGLLQTLQSVGILLGGIDLSGDVNLDEVFPELIGGLKEPLIGMGTAFSSSLMGLFTSLTLGLINVFSASAHSNFMLTFESWLTDITDLSGAEGGTASGAGANTAQAGGTGLSDEATNALLDRLDANNKMSADINHNIKMLFLEFQKWSTTTADKADLQIEATRESALNILNSQDQLASQFNVFHDSMEKSSAASTAFNQLSVKNLKTLNEHAKKLVEAVDENLGTFHTDFKELIEIIDLMQVETREQQADITKLFDDRSEQIIETLGRLRVQTGKGMKSIREAQATSLEEARALGHNVSGSRDRLEQWSAERNLFEADTKNALNDLYTNLRTAVASVQENTDVTEEALLAIKATVEAMRQTNHADTDRLIEALTAAPNYLAADHKTVDRGPQSRHDTRPPPFWRRKPKSHAVPAVFDDPQDGPPEVPAHSAPRPAAGSDPAPSGAGFARKQLQEIESLRQRVQGLTALAERGAADDQVIDELAETNRRLKELLAGDDATPRADLTMTTNTAKRSSGEGG